MGIGPHAETFAGLPVKDFRPGAGGGGIWELPAASSVDDPEGTAYRLRLEYDDSLSFEELFQAFLEDPNSERVTALLIGTWVDEMYDASTATLVESLVAAADRLPMLKGLFLVDVVQEENEISWIVQCDVSPIWQAFPRLEYVTLRGSQGLSLGTIEHANLRELVVECGGLPGEVVRQVAAAKLPELEHLELYLGTEEYGWSGTMDDVKAVLEADFPKLRYLGLRDAEEADAVAALVADSPILDRIDVLDLSLGAMSDEGGRHLLNGERIRRLKRLDLHYHFMSEATCDELEGLPMEVDVSGREEPDEYDGEIYRYVAVGE